MNSYNLRLSNAFLIQKSQSNTIDPASTYGKITIGRVVPERKQTVWNLYNFWKRAKTTKSRPSTTDNLLKNPVRRDRYQNYLTAKIKQGLQRYFDRTKRGNSTEPVNRSQVKIPKTLPNGNRTIAPKQIETSNASKYDEINLLNKIWKVIMHLLYHELQILKKKVLKPSFTIFFIVAITPLTTIWAERVRART